MPVWHASVSIRARRGRGPVVVDPALLEETALALCGGVGGSWERWRISPAGIGHLHVPVTAAEFVEIPPGLVVGDAGETGPERPRTRPA